MASGSHVVNLAWGMYNYIMYNYIMLYSTVVTFLLLQLKHYTFVPIVSIVLLNNKALILMDILMPLFHALTYLLYLNALRRKTIRIKDIIIKD